MYKSNFSSSELCSEGVQTRHNLQATNTFLVCKCDLPFMKFVTYFPF